MSTRSKFIARIKSQLDEGKSELHQLEARARNAQADIQEKYHHAAEELHKKRLLTEMKLEEIGQSSEEAWHEFKDDAEKAWAAFKAGLDAFRDFSDHS